MLRQVVSPSVCLSVTLRYHDHIGWKSSKIISRLVWDVHLLFTNPNIHGSTQRGTPKILAGIGEGYRKRDFRRTKALISLKRGEIRPRLLLRSDMKLYTRFRLVRINQRPQMTFKRDSRSTFDLAFRWAFRWAKAKFRLKSTRKPSWRWQTRVTRKHAKIAPIRRVSFHFTEFQFAKFQITDA